jgi:hypothetical protein
VRPISQVHVHNATRIKGSGSWGEDGPVRAMSRLKLPEVLFWLLAGASAVLLVVLALILSGVIPVDPASQSGGAPADALEQQRTTTSKPAPTAPVTTSAAALSAGTVSVVLPVENAAV